MTDLEKQALDSAVAVAKAHIEKEDAVPWDYAILAVVVALDQLRDEVKALKETIDGMGYEIAEAYDRGGANDDG